MTECLSGTRTTGKTAKLWCMWMEAARALSIGTRRRSVVYGAEIQQGGYRAMRRDDCATRARREIARRACDQHRTTDRGACSSLPRSLLARSLPGSPSHDAHPQARRRGVQRAIGATMAARIE